VIAMELDPAASPSELRHALHHTQTVTITEAVCVSSSSEFPKR
jgi:hypothetical protein